MNGGSPARASALDTARVLGGVAAAFPATPLDRVRLRPAAGGGLDGSLPLPGGLDPLGLRFGVEPAH